MDVFNSALALFLLIFVFLVLGYTIGRNLNDERLEKMLYDKLFESQSKYKAGDVVITNIKFPTFHDSAFIVYSVDYDKDHHTHTYTCFSVDGRFSICANEYQIDLASNTNDTIVLKEWDN